MLLENENAVVYGGAGSVGGAVARAFAREGARVCWGRGRDGAGRRARRAGRPAEMAFEQFARPITKAMRNQFLTARAVARHMTSRGSGVILTITGGDREAVPTLGGTLVAWAAIEAQCRQWACELGPQGVRVVWLRTTGLPEAIPDTGDAVADLARGLGRG